MKNSENENFDAELVMVADSEIQNANLRLYHNNISIVSPHAILNHALKIRKRDMMGESEAISNMIFGNLDKNLEKLKSEYGEEVVDIVLEGRLRVSLLLDSGVGIVGAGDQFRNYFKHVQINKGKIESYLKFASGPATEMFLESDARFGFPGSMLVCVPITEGTPDFVEERYDDLMYLMNRSVDEPKRKKLKDKINKIEDENPDDPEYGFSADEMVYLGMLDEKVKSLDELRKIFLDRTKITLLSEDLSEEFEQSIHDFFKEE